MIGREHFMVRNDGKYMAPTTADPSLRSARTKCDEASRPSFMEWVWRFLERYPASLPVLRADAQDSGWTCEGSSESNSSVREFVDLGAGKKIGADTVNIA